MDSPVPEVGQVVEVRQRLCVVSKFHRSFAADADRLRRFEQEARAAAALNHPNILAVYQMGTHAIPPSPVAFTLPTRAGGPGQI